MENKYNLISNEVDEDESIILLENYRKILNEKIDKKQLINFIKDLINKDENLSFSSKNSEKFIDENKPLFKIKLKLDKNHYSSEQIIELKKDYLYKNIISKVSDHSSRLITKNSDIESIIKKLQTKFSKEIINNLVINNTFTVLVDVDSELCYLEYLV